MKTNSEYRAAARETLSGRWNELAVLSLVILVIVAIAQTPATIGSIAHLTTLSLVGNCWNVLLAIFITFPLECAFYNLFLPMIRHEETTDSYMSNLFKNFTTNWYIFVLAGFLMSIILALIAFPTLLIGVFVLAFAYALVPYVLYDNPEISPIEALRTSRFMMRGHKWDLFCLCLPFLGWAILSVFTLFIGLLWVMPYASATMAHFYEDVKAEYEAEQAQEAQKAQA